MSPVEISELPMPGPAKAGLFLYAKDLANLSRFYESVLRLARAHATEEMVVLNAAALQLIVHAIPPSIAEGIVISSPPLKRDSTALKFFFTVASIEAASVEAATLGGQVFGEQWEGPGFRVCNAMDPEGNVFQVRESVA